jgi:hypothetical protein
MPITFGCSSEPPESSRRSLVRLLTEIAGPTASQTRTPRRDRDHRPDSALTTAAANPAGIEAGMHMRAFPANSISIAGAAAHPASSPAGAIRT